MQPKLVVLQPKLLAIPYKSLIRLLVSLGADRPYHVNRDFDALVGTLDVSDSVDRVSVDHRICDPAIYNLYDGLIILLSSWFYLLEI
jgi:hypothetical protein